MARPKKDESERLTKPVAFRLTEKDYVAYLQKFESSGLTQSEFFRECVLTNRTQIIAKQKASSDKKRLLFIANKASNNINQLAHRANADHVAGTISQQTYIDVLQELQLLNRYLKATLSNVD